jgi:hypothetical protein
MSIYSHLAKTNGNKFSYQYKIADNCQLLQKKKVGVKLPEKASHSDSLIFLETRSFLLSRSVPHLQDIAATSISYFNSNINFSFLLLTMT